MQILTKFKFLKSLLKKNMFPSSDFYQILCRYTKFYADSEFNFKKKKILEKIPFFEKTKKLGFLPNSGHPIISYIIRFI